MTAPAIAPTARPPAPAWRPADELADAVRGLIAHVPWDGTDTEPAVRSIGLVGCTGGEGATTVAAALAVELAAARRDRVLLVDAHSARPAAHRLFGVRPGPGLAEAVQDGVRLRDLVQPTAVPHLSVLAAGVWFDQPDGPGPAGLIEALDEEFAVTVWDLPPAAATRSAATPPAIDFAASLDGLVLVVEAERTPLEAAERAAATLGARGRLLGAVLNKRPAHTPDWITRVL